jgi:hypothetical protein
MDDTQFTKPLWYTLQETSLVNLTILCALVGIAGYAMWTLMCIELALAGAL